jgi:hypothetical protein
MGLLEAKVIFGKQFNQKKHLPSYTFVSVEK